MFEKFTTRSRQVVVLAQAEARAFRHNYIGTEHILLSLLREHEGLAARALDDLEVTTDKARAQVIRLVGFGDEPVAGLIPFTPRAKKVLERALREMLSLGHNYIGTEHILLGLLGEDEGVSAQILRDLGVQPAAIRAQVMDLLSGPRDRSQAAAAPSARALGDAGGTQWYAALHQALATARARWPRTMPAVKVTLTTGEELFLESARVVGGGLLELVPAGPGRVIVIPSAAILMLEVLEVGPAWRGASAPRAH